VAIGNENDSIEFYKGQLGKAIDSKDKKLLADLVRFEELHRDALQDEQIRLNRSFYWAQ
jgi:rubrerythrin